MLDLDEVQDDKVAHIQEEVICFTSSGLANYRKLGMLKEATLVSEADTLDTGFVELFEIGGDDDEPA